MTNIVHGFTCFICCSDKDRAFAEQLHADLCKKGVRCWIMMHNIIVESDLGTKNPVTKSIQKELKDPQAAYIVVLSEYSACNDWLMKQAQKTTEEEFRHKNKKLHVVYTDSFAKEADIEWVKNSCDTHNASDFESWKDSGSYQKSFDRLLRTVFKAPASHSQTSTQPEAVHHGIEKKVSKKSEKETCEPIDDTVKYLSSFPIFETLGEDGIKDLVSFLRKKIYAAGDIIINKGEPGRNLFIIMSGTVEVLGEGDASITTMGRGEVFGDMSLLTGNPVVATIKAIKQTTILKLSKEYFNSLLAKYPTFQMYLMRLLVERLSRVDDARAQELSSAMAGQLSEMPPSELLQALNINQKTGVVSLELPKGKASISFSEGEVVGAKYVGLSGEEAFFKIVGENQGRFRFAPGLPKDEMGAPQMGSFMSLLMEATRRMDENM